MFISFTCTSFLLRSFDRSVCQINMKKYFEIFDGICRDERLDCQLLSLGSDLNHIHLVVRFPPALAISKLVQFLKGRYSHEWNTLYANGTSVAVNGQANDGSTKPKTYRFSWSSGYFVKTIGQSTMGETAGNIGKQGFNNNSDKERKKAEQEKSIVDSAILRSSSSTQQDAR
jgi:REP element-mobilizing transposase RayT